MPESLHPASAHIPVWIVALLCLSAVSLMILWVAAFIQSRRLHLISEWRWRGSGGAGFAESTAAWADINKEADRSFVSEDAGRLDQGPE